MGDYYILEGRTAVPTDLMTWARWFETAGKSRILRRSEIGDCAVSTVFLGSDHRFGDEGPPLIFETLVFDGPLDQEMERYSTYDEAEAGHNAMCARVRDAEGKSSKQGEG